MLGCHLRHRPDAQSGGGKGRVHPKEGAPRSGCPLLPPTVPSPSCLPYSWSTCLFPLLFHLFTSLWHRAQRCASPGTCLSSGALQASFREGKGLWRRTSAARSDPGPKHPKGGFPQTNPPAL